MAAEKWHMQTQVWVYPWVGAREGELGDATLAANARLLRFRSPLRRKNLQQRPVERGHGRVADSSWKLHCY